MFPWYLYTFLEEFSGSLPMELTRKSHGSFPQSFTLMKETTHMKLCLEL